MAAITIKDVSLLDCRLVVQVEFHHADDTFWHIENFAFQGREGLKHKRMTNGLGEILMDNGEVAPSRVVVQSDDPDDVDGLKTQRMQYLPEGRSWARHTTCHMDENSILDQVRDTYQQRLISGWAQGHVDTISRIPTGNIKQADHDGCDVLLTKFAYLKGQTL
jgi:hypothetical protein